jgi:hypothetical protein
MAPPKHDHERDALDRALSKVVRSARRPRGVPAPGRDEPSDDELLRVIEGSASAEERARVQAAGAFTQERLAVLREALAETGHAPTALQRAARYVFVLAKDALDLLRAATEPVAVPAAATVRSGPQTAQERGGGKACYYEFVQPFQDVEAHLKIEHVTRANANATIDVQIRLVGGGKGARVSLVSAGQTLDSMPVDENGAATFSGLGQAQYEIEVRRAGKAEPIGKLHLDFLRA